MKKKIMSLLTLYSLCVNAKTVDLFDLIDEGEQTISESPLNSASSNLPSQAVQDDDEPASAGNPCSLLDLLLADAPTHDLFIDKNEKFYRGHFPQMGLTYIDTSVWDPRMSASMRAACAIDQSKLSSQEKEIVAKYYHLYKQHYEAPWYIKFISKTVGYGVFAAADIEPGQLIGEYAGLLYDDSVAPLGAHNGKYSWNITPPSFSTDGRRYFVDAAVSCNFARIINHSYEPNIVPVVLHTPEGSRMLYVASEKIKKDQQLLVNYGPEYWKHLGEPQKLSR